MEDTPAAQLEKGLRQPLSHLGDDAFLGQSTLIPLLGLAGAADSAAALRDVLERAIAAFRPASEAEPCSRTWRYYQVLSGRYLQGDTQRAVALRLGVTPRHLRREQGAAVRALASHLALRFDLTGERTHWSVVPSAPAGHQSELNREMLWLADTLRGQTSEVRGVLTEALELAGALAQKHAVACALDVPDDLPPVCVPPTVLKQIVLNLLAAIIGELPAGSRVEVAARGAAEQVTITLAAGGGSGYRWAHTELCGASSTVSRQLAQVFRGDIELCATDETIAIHVTLPHVGRRILVMAVEDNLDTLQLWQRYTRRTRFALVQETDAEQTIASAARLRPDLIILDIMLPGTDGWEILHQLRQHPATAAIPVIVCTVLPQRELALSLGASDFIPKPATGGEFRAVLERRIAAAEPPRSPQSLPPDHAPIGRPAA